MKICAVALNLLQASPFARDSSALTPLHIALQHGCTSAACFIVTRAPATAMMDSPERRQPAIIDAITHWHCGTQFISACISADPSLLFKLVNGRDLSSWATQAGRSDITNFIKRNQATLRALTGTGQHVAQSDQNRRISSSLRSVESYSLQKKGAETVTLHTSHLTPHTSHLTPHTSHLTPHTSHLTPHMLSVSDGTRSAAAEISALAVSHMIPIWMAKRLFRKRSLPDIPLHNASPAAFDAGRAGVSPRGARSLGQVQMELLRVYACR